MFNTLMHILYVPICIFLILVVLLQTGKRADLAGAFGGGGSQTAFGARGAATFLTKLTTVAAVLFMLIALTLSIVASKEGGSSGSVLDSVPASTSAPAPADPLELTDQPAAADEPAAADDGVELAEEPTDPQTGTEEDAADPGDGSQP